MPSRASGYAFFIPFLGVTLIPYFLYQVLTQLESQQWILLAALTVLTSSLAAKVRLAGGRRGSITLSDSNFMVTNNENPSHFFVSRHTPHHTYLQLTHGMT